MLTVVDNVNMGRSVMKSLLIGAAALALASSAANAGIVGTTVTLNYLFPDFGTVFGSTDVTVATNPTTLACAPGGPGVCAAFAENALFTITDDSFTVSEDAGSSYTPDPFNGIQYVDPGITITGVTLTTNLPGLTAADVGFNAHAVWYNGSGLDFTNASYFVTLTVTTVPELSTWAMMVLGFAGLGFAGYRTRKATAALAV
jgi:hypothetical protein